MGKRIEVDDRLLLAADRMYDAIDSVLLAMRACPVDVPPAIEEVRYQLQQAKANYDAAISQEQP